MIWLAVPLVVVVLTLLALRVQQPMKEFEEVRRRERAMKALSNRYDPSNDVVLKRRGLGTPTAD